MSGDPKQLVAANQELRRCLGRLSFVGNGLSKPLDKALANLRQLLKQDADEQQILQSIDDISRLLRELDEPQNQNSIIEVFDPERLLDDLARQPLPPPLRKEFSTLKSNLGKTAEEIAAQMAAVIEDYIERQEKSLSSSEQRDAARQQVPKKPGFWARLFGFGRPAEEPSQSDVETPAHKPSVEISESLRSSLNNLAQQLAVIDGYAKLAKTLKQKINHLRHVSELGDILELIAGAFCEFAGHEHRQFEAFLKQLTRRVEQINSFINATVDHHAESEKASGELEADLKQSVSNIHDSLQASQSLSEIKASVASKIDTIVERVNLFVINQAAAREKFEAETQKLKEQLKVTEDEAARLRQSLAEQHSRAQTDPLTQLPNRYSYNDRLTQEYNRWRRYRSPLTMVIADIDHFKSINDVFGHQAGDKILKSVAAQISHRLRESDFVARFGGEEFVILLPETNLVAATKVMNKLRQEIAAKHYQLNGQKKQITVSFGVSEFENNDTANEVFERADKALYRAKEKGRNQVCCQRAPRNG